MPRSPQLPVTLRFADAIPVRDRIAITFDLIHAFSIRDARLNGHSHPITIHSDPDAKPYCGADSYANCDC